MVSMRAGWTPRSSAIRTWSPPTVSMNASSFGAHGAAQAVTPPATNNPPATSQGTPAVLGVRFYVGAADDASGYVGPRATPRDR